MKPVNLFTIIFLIALIFIVAGPFIQIWAINTLFKTSIEYSWLNWFCVMILNSSIGRFLIEVDNGKF